MDFGLSGTAGLWLAVVVSGLYHGLNPGMGWPLAVSAGLMGNGRRDLLRALVPLWLGHLIAMLAVLLPFGLMSGLIQWAWEIRIGASVLVIAAGVFLALYRRHPRFLARIAPHKLALWSFAIAMAHGAGLMLLPVYLGLCGVDDVSVSHQAAAELVLANVWVAVLVGVVHSLSMIGGGGAMALAIHEWLGLKFLTKTWFNLDLVWALSLIVVGVIALVLALQDGPGF